jgi:hypothetical protein
MTDTPNQDDNTAEDDNSITLDIHNSVLGQSSEFAEDQEEDDGEERT